MSNRRTSKMCMALMLVVSMIFSTLQLGGVVSFAATADKLVVYVAVEGTNASGAAVTVDKTPVVVEDGAMAADAIKTVLSKSAYKDNYVISQSSWGLSLDEIGGLKTESEGDNWYYWSFYVNGNYSDYGIGSYPVKDQDKISLIYTYNNTNMTAAAYEDDASKNPTKEQAGVLLNTAIANKNTLAAVIYRDVFVNGAKVPVLGGNVNDFYTVYSLAKAGFEAPEFYQEVYGKLVEDFAVLNAGKALSDGTTMESIENSGYATSYYAKLALAVSAMGEDPTNVGGVDLVKKVLNKEIFEKSAKSADYGTYAREGMALMALNEGEWKGALPVGVEYVTEAELVNAQAADVINGIDVAISWSAFDTVAMALQSLAPYVNTTNENVDQNAVKKAVDQGFAYMETMQGKDGSVGNGWTTAQVMYAAGLFGYNILDEKDVDFIKNGVTILDHANVLVNATEQTVDPAFMTYQPEQLVRGYQAVIASAIKDGVGYTEALTGTAITADLSGAEIKTIPDQTYTGKEKKPVVKVIVQYKDSATGELKNIALTEKKQYTVSYSNNKKLGKATVTVKGIGAFSGEVKKNFKIVLGKVSLTSVKKSGKISFKKVTGATKYKVQISTDKAFKKNVVTKTVKSTSLTYKFKKGKTSYVRVCAVNGSNKGAYSVVKSVKVNK